MSLSQYLETVLAVESSYVIKSLKDDLFCYLRRREENFIAPHHITLLPKYVKHLPKGGANILNLALSCKLLFNTFVELINVHFLFRCPETPGKLYSPKHLVAAHFSVSPSSSTNKHLHFPYSTTSVMCIDSFLPSFPSTLTHLWVLSIPINTTLPPTLTHLKVVGALETENLPVSLTHVSLNIISCTNFSIPPFLIYLSINASVPNLPLLPVTLTTLKLRSGIFSPLQTFPPNLTHLEVGYCSDDPPPLPPSLRTLKVLSPYGHFASEIQRQLNSLPPSLTTLQLSAAQHGMVNFPPQLERLSGGFGIEFEKLPSTLTHLALDPENDQIVNNFPSKLKSITFPTMTNPTTLSNHLSLPATLQTIHNFIEIHFVQSLPCLARMTFVSQVSYLPPFVTHLTFGDEYNFPIPLLPTGVTHLHIGAAFDHIIPPLPATLTHLVTYSSKHPLPHLPTALVHLTLGDLYSHSLPYLPPNIFYFAGYNANHPLPPLPTSLHTLILGNKFKHPLYLTPHHSLKYLVLGRNFHCPIQTFPPSLMWLRCQKIYFEEVVQKDRESGKLPLTCHVYALDAISNWGL